MRKALVAHQCPGTDDDGRPLRPEPATCGRCHRSWCDRCDPAPSALCHYCHGRGYSDAALSHLRSNAARRGALLRRLVVALLLALTPTLAHGQGLYHLGFTLDGRPGPGWVETPLGVVTELDVIVWRLTLRGVVPVAEVLRERIA